MVALACLILFASLASGQPSLELKTGSFPRLALNTDDRIREDQYVFYQASHTLTTVERSELKAKGIEVLYALQQHVYWIRITDTIDEAIARDLFDLNPAYKIGLDESQRTSTNRFRLSVAPGLSQEDILEWADQNHYRILDHRALRYGMLDVEIGNQSFEKLLRTPWISFICAIPKDEVVNYRAIHGERGWALVSPLGRGLTGEGMTVGIGDGGRVEVHEDLRRSYLDLASFETLYHATQTSGIVTGAGLIDPFYGSGYAPEAKVILRNFSDILWDAPQYFEDFGLTLTNNSYGSSLTTCTYFGDYDASSAALDAMMADIPSLLHVFSAGNSGGATCSPFPFRYATISGGYQVAKNLLTVGATGNTDVIANFSSRGPVDDGRLKPEVVAYGNGRYTTFANNQYGSNSGTSFSSPATMGIATLLYERYKELHNDSLPDAALIKNVICNAADDLGNTGPDYTYGFGRINGDRAAKIIEDIHYTSLSVDHGNTATRTFSVPFNSSVDIMAMWSDKPATPYSTVTLVNDLDMTVVTPAGDTMKPWILDFTPTGVGNSAINGYDHYNNYEQVSIPNATPGNYTIVVKGHQVPLGPQLAWITWDIQPAGIKVQSPNGGEVFRPGADGTNQQFIRWDAFGTGNSTFTVDYSTNGGTNWTVLNNAVPAANRYLDWFPPAINSDELKVRVTASNGMTDVSDANAVLLPIPTNLVASSPCNGNIQLTWTAIAGITKYKVFLIKNERLIPVDTITGTSFIIRDQPFDSAVWVTVAGVFPSGAIGMRARAISITANGGNNCPWTMDIRLDSLVNLNDGRKFTSTELNGSETVTLHLTNTGTTGASGFLLHYNINGGVPATQAFAGTLNPAAGTDFNFIKPADLAVPGTYHFKAWITYVADPFHENDTIKLTVHQYGNGAITLPWMEDFETAADTTLLSSFNGLPDVNSIDVVLAAGSRLRTYAGTPFCFNGQRALTVDAVKTSTSKHGEFLMTLNMSSFDATSDDIRLSFQSMHHEIIPDISNTEAVWIRGADTLPFVLLMMISNDAITRGTWKNFAGLELSETLLMAGQNYSSSFQLKFVFDVYATAGQINSQDGASFDKFQLTLIVKDLAVTGITQPSPSACDLGLETITALVTNTSELPVGNATIQYRVNGGTIFSTAVGPIAANTTVPVSLLPPFNFSTPGLYHLEAWSSSAEENFAANDTFRMEVLQNSLITNYPYLEGFESGDGGYLTSGTRSSWAHGVPGKQNFSRAAEGEQAWCTSLSSFYNPDELSYLYSPCFDLTGLTQPWLSFAFQYQLETNFDYAWVEYRLSGSNTWVKLGAMGGGVNWYNHVSNTWNGNQLKWNNSGIAIPVTDTIVQFRWVMQSDVGLEMEGVSLDQVHVYDRTAMYTGGNVQVTQAVSGNNWVHFTSGNQRIFSIQPMGQNLGNVTVNLYKSGSNFLTSDSLYLMSRNWVLSSTISPSSPIKMRGYFTATEATNLVNANGCSQCISARDGFDVAALRYTGTNQDGTYSNNNPNQVITYPRDSTQIAPYDAGFYAEWSTPGMSEWWVTSTVTKWSGGYDEKISSSTDDAEEHEFSGSVNPYRESLALTELSGKQKLGWRFRYVTIPKGSYIESAHIEWTSAATNTVASNWILQSEMSVSSPPFTASKYNISLRTRSAQAVQWTPAAWNTINTTFNSPDIRHVIQQVVDQTSWVTGRDLTLILRGNGLREAWSYDGDSLKGAKLVVTYKNVCNETGICYVNKNATGTQDGNSWTNAYRSLEQALDRTVHCAGIDEIWMTGGTYSPFFEVSRTNGYMVRPGVKIYGGFQGNETAINQRVYGLFPTILSGDIGTTGISSDNLYHVITIQNGAEETILDGLMIKDGLANGSSLDLQRGSAIYNLGNLKVQKVTVQNSNSPSVYNAPGSILNAFELMDVKQ